LTYGRVLDTSALDSELGFAPDYSSEDAFVAFVQGIRAEVTRRG